MPSSGERIVRREECATMFATDRDRGTVRWYRFRSTLGRVSGPVLDHVSNGIGRVRAQLQHGVPSRPFRIPPTPTGLGRPP